MLASTSFASITLPLEGYFRPGQYFPIQLDGDDSATTRIFSSDGCLSTETKAGKSQRRIVPMLVTGLPTSLNVDRPSHDPMLLRCPSYDERLIATTTADISSACGVFPTNRLIAIRLDLADPLPGPPAVWEALDGLVLDAAEFSRVSDAKRSALLAGGVTLICPAEIAPDATWPWQRRGTVWVLTFRPTGPVGQIVNEDGYAPTYAWNPSWPARVRQQVMGVGTLLVFITVALLLRSNRWTIGSVIVLTIVATVVIAMWRQSLGSIARAGGDVLIIRGALTQRDAWVYERARESSTQSVLWSGWTHPMFGTLTAEKTAGMKLLVDANDELNFEYSAIAGHTMAFVRREILPAEMPVSRLPVKSPMLEAARSVYLDPGDKIVGEALGSAGRWPTVVVRASTAVPAERH